MQEKRRYKRVNADMKLTIYSIFQQDNLRIKDIDAPIKIIDISKDGIGFISSSILPLNFYFNANLNFGSDDSELYCVVKIIRCEPITAEEFHYGCQFVGRAAELDAILTQFDNE